MDVGPSRAQKIFFWFILASLSVFFAEVVSGSFPYPYFDAWGWIAVLPLYGLHTLVLASFVWARKRGPSFRTLFLAGAVFGLYEAYLTQQLWSPTWGAAVNIGGIAVFEYFVLVLWWHPWFAFILPLFVAETYVLGGVNSERMLPWPVRKMFQKGKGKRIVLIFVSFCGLLQGGQLHNPVITITSIMGTGLIVLGLVALWKRKYGNKSHTMRELLPGPKETPILLGVLAVFSLWMVIYFARPGAIPGILPQLFIVLSYVFFIALAILSKKLDARDDNKSVPLGLDSGVKRMILLLGLMTACAVVAALSPVGFLFMLIGWFGGGALGAVILVLAVRDLIMNRKKDNVGVGHKDGQR